MEPITDHMRNVSLSHRSAVAMSATNAESGAPQEGAAAAGAAPSGSTAGASKGLGEGKSHSLSGGGSVSFAPNATGVGKAVTIGEKVGARHQLSGGFHLASARQVRYRLSIDRTEATCGVTWLVMGI